MTPQPPDLTTVKVIANPAMTVGRAFTDTFAGISPGSAPAFIGAQLVGLVVGLVLLVALYPRAGRAAGEVVVPTATSRACGPG